MKSQTEMAGVRDPNEGSWAEARGRRGLAGAPTAHASLLYRILILMCRVIAVLLGIRIRFEGAEHLPRDAAGRPGGGWIAAGLPHRTWIDPFVLVLALPVEPRLSWFGDGRAIHRGRFRRWIFARIGGVVPIWPGGGREAVDAHFAAAGSVLAVGGVFALFPEVGPAVPLEQARPLGGGIGYIAVRTGAPIVPLVLGGAHELYLGRRIIVRALPPIGWRELVGFAANTAPPEAGSRAERDIARRVTSALHALTVDAVAAAHHDAEPAPGSRKVWTGLTRLFH